MIDKKRKDTSSSRLAGRLIGVITYLVIYFSFRTLNIGLTSIGFGLLVGFSVWIGNITTKAITKKNTKDNNKA